MIRVHIEILSSLTETLDIEKKGEKISIEQEIEEGETVSDLLTLLATGYPRFGQVVFDIGAKKLTEGVSIFFNGRNLELLNGLATKLTDGDSLVFVPIIVGG